MFVCFVKPSLNSFSEKVTEKANITVYAVWKCINNLPKEQSNGTKSYVYLMSSTYVTLTQRDKTTTYVTLTQRDKTIS